MYVTHLHGHLSHTSSHLKDSKTRHSQSRRPFLHDLQNQTRKQDPEVSFLQGWAWEDALLPRFLASYGPLERAPLPTCLP